MMARDDDSWNRLRKREDEEEREREKQQDRSKQESARPANKFAPPSTGEAGNLHDLLERVDPLIDQLNSLYQAFVSGLEKRPPIERRTHLERTMDTLALMGKPTQALQFRYNTLHARYMTHKERWDKLLRAFEDGKIGKKAR